jgi:hypothetical protein
MKITTFSEPKELVKEGLLFYSSTEQEPLIDSAGNSHIVKPEDIVALANNTNEYLKFTDIYVFPDHDRDPAKAYGLITDSGCFEAKEINDELVQKHPKLGTLKGRWGLFCNNVRLVEENIIDKVSKGLSKSVSIGADMARKIVKELSITATPAAVGSALFNNKLNISNFNMDNKLPSFASDTTAVTLEEALQTEDDDEQLKSEAIELLCTFLTVINNIAAMSDEDLGNYQVASKEELYQAQLESFMMMLDEKINPFANAEMLDQQQSQTDPRMQQQSQYSVPLAITTFDEMDQYISEYGLGSLAKGIGKKIGGSLIGQSVKTAGSGLKSGFNNGKGFGKIKSAFGGAGTALKKKGLATKLTNKVQSALNKGANKLGVIGKPLAAANRAVSRGRARGGFNSSSKLSKFIK